MLLTFLVILTLMVLYWFPIRRWFQRWGTTREDRTRVMAGDPVITNPTHSATHAPSRSDAAPALIAHPRSLGIVPGKAAPSSNVVVVADTQNAVATIAAVPYWSRLPSAMTQPVDLYTNPLASWKRVVICEVKLSKSMSSIVCDTVAHPARNAGTGGAGGVSKAMTDVDKTLTV
jgi:hypothetical protein